MGTAAGTATRTPRVLARIRWDNSRDREKVDCKQSWKKLPCSRVIAKHPGGGAILSVSPCYLLQFLPTHACLYFMFLREDMVMFSMTSLVRFQDMFQERSRMSSAHEANTQRLMSALRDKETALKVRMVFTLGRFLFFTAASLLYVLQTTTTDSPHRGHWIHLINVVGQTKFMSPLTDAVLLFLMEQIDSYRVRLKPITFENKELNIQCTESNNDSPWLAVIARLLFILSYVPHTLQNVGSSGFLAL